MVCGHCPPYWRDLADSVSPIFDDAIGHDSTGVDISLSPHSIQINSSEIGSSQVATQHPSSTIEVGINQFSISQISSTKTSRDQTSPTQISPTQISTIQVGLNQTDIPQVSFTEINSGHVTFGDILPTEIYPTQVHPFGFSEPNNVRSKITNSGSIETQNFLVSNDSSVFHSSISQLVSNLHNTTLSAWDGLLNSSIDLVVKDLPTGQLAESTITGYDTNGRPNAGTLTLDSNGNNVGWFLDTTPDDNSEFSTKLADTASCT